MPRALKVYRTAIGFHDAYVAAPSMKAALAAWGAQKDLFAIGAAEIVTDPALAKDALASPGEVIRRSRGGLAEQLAAMPDRPERVKAEPRKKTKETSARKPKPKPGRDALDEAEAALQTFTDRAEADLAALRKQEEQLRRTREALERRQAAEAQALEQKVSRASERYESALAKWRETL